MNKVFTVTILILLSLGSRSQIYVPNMTEMILTGSLREEGNLTTPVRWAKVEVKGTAKVAYADGTGYFVMDGKGLDIESKKSMTLIISADGYETKELTPESGRTDIGVIFMKVKYSDINPITVNDLMPDVPEIGNQQISDIGAAALFWNSDALSRATNFQLGMHGFKMRGYDRRNTEVYLNGASFNDPETGYAFASLLNGFIDISKKNTGSSRILDNKIFYGDIGGYSNISINPLEMTRRTKISYAFSNSLFTHSLNASYSTGEMASGWALSFYLAGRTGEGFIKGTNYESVSYLFSAGKTIDDYHSFSFLVAGAPTKRGLVNWSTQETYDQNADNYYNSSWGYYKDNVKTSRQNLFHQPVITLLHEWEGEISTLNTSLMLSGGNRQETGLNWNDFSPPAEPASGFENPFASAGQIRWDSLYSSNMASPDGRSKYILDAQTSDRMMMSLNSVFDLFDWKNLETTGGIELKLYSGRYSNEVFDLLGGNHWLNVDKFQTPPINPDYYQFDINNPDREVGTGGKTGHDYSIRQQSYKLWNVWRYYMGPLKFSLGASASYLAFGYSGNLKNGKVINSGLRQDARKFFNFSGKAGAAYKIAATSDVEINAMYAHRAPLFANSYLSPRTSGMLLPGLTNEKIMSFEANYTLYNALMDLRVSGFFTLLKDRSVVRSYYDDNYLSRINMGISGLDSRYIGGEATVKFNITSTLKADASVTYGVYQYVSDPNITLMQENTNAIQLTDTLNMKNVFVGNAPQMALSAGGSYESPLNFWAGLNFCYTGQSYSDVNPVAFVKNLPEPTPDDQQQIKLKGAFTVNFNGGYTFLLGEKHRQALSLNVNIQNLFGNTNGVLGAYAPFGLNNSGTKYAYMYGRTFHLMIRFLF
jgi:hypothetical protein